MKAGYKNVMPLSFSIFNKIIPQSAVARALCFACFGYSLPMVSSGHHWKAPPNPFKPIEDDKEWDRLITTLYPRD